MTKPKPKPKPESLQTRQAVRA